MVWDETTGTETIATGTVTGVIPIYVIDKASPVTAIAVQGSGTRMMIGKNHIGKMQKNHWYGYDMNGNQLPTAEKMGYVGIPESVYDENGDEVEQSLLEGGSPYRGTAYLMFNSQQLHPNQAGEDAIGKLKSAIGTSQSFVFIDSNQANKLEINENTNELLSKYSVEQGGVAMYMPTVADISLTGESGILAFPNIATLKINGSGNFTVNTQNGPLATMDTMFSRTPDLNFSQTIIGTYELTNISSSGFNKNITVNPTRTTSIKIENCSTWTGSISNLNRLSALTTLSLNKNAFTSFSISPEVAMSLTTLNVKENPSTISVTSNSKLNSLTSADFTKNTGNITVTGPFNNLGTLTVTGCKANITVNNAAYLSTINADTSETGASGKTLSLTATGNSLSSGTTVEAASSRFGTVSITNSTIASFKGSSSSIGTVSIMNSNIKAFDGRSSGIGSFLLGNGTAANSSNLGSLDMSGSTSLSTVRLDVRNTDTSCSPNFSGCTNLTSLEGSGKLGSLNLESTKIDAGDGGTLSVYGTLTVSRCPNLTVVSKSCNFHNLMTYASAFKCEEEHSITSIDFSGCTRLTSIEINDNGNTKNLEKVFIPSISGLTKLSLKNGKLGLGGADTTGPSQFTIVTTYDHYKTYYLCEENYNSYMGYGVSSLIEVGTTISGVGTVVEVNTEKVECTETIHYEPGTWQYEHYGPEVTRPKNSPYCNGHSDSDDDTYHCHSHYVITVRGQTTSVSSALDGVTDYTTMWDNPKMQYGLIFNGSLICSGWLRPSDSGMQKLAQMASSNRTMVDLSGNDIVTKTYNTTTYQAWEGGLFSLRQWNGTSSTISTDTYFATNGNDGYNSSPYRWISNTGHTHDAGYSSSDSLQKSGNSFYYNLTATINSSKKACGGCDGGRITANLYFYPFGK